MQMGKGSTEQQVQWQHTSQPPLPQNRSRKHHPVTFPETCSLLQSQEQQENVIPQDHCGKMINPLRAQPKKGSQESSQ